MALENAIIKREENFRQNPFCSQKSLVYLSVSFIEYFFLLSKYQENNFDSVNFVQFIKPCLPGDRNGHKDWGCTTLYFGCRNSKVDHIYFTETAQATRDKYLTNVFTALSREPGQPKVMLLLYLDSLNNPMQCYCTI